MKRWLLAWFFVHALGACASPLVGLNCADGFTQCGDQCVDLSSDLANCGECGNACPASNFMCVDGRCARELADGGLDFDAMIPDGGGDGSPGDGGSDGSTGGDGGGTTGDPTVLPPPPDKPRCDGTTEPDECRCPLGELKCGNECVDGLSDPNNCGQCGTQCDVDGFCVQGSCVEACDPPLVRCGGLCVDTASDINNCGSCGNRCDTRICDEGRCVGAPAGHVVVIGHDYRSTNPQQSKIPPAAVILNNNFRPRILGFSDHSEQVVVDRINATLGSVNIQPEDITPAILEGLGIQLATHDVLLIYPQTEVTQSDLLTKVIGPLDGILRDFLVRGGVVVLFEGGGDNDGTFQMVSEQGLANITAMRKVDRGRVVKTPQGYRDFTNGLTDTYRGENNTFGFEGLQEQDAIAILLRHQSSDLPVVIHNIFIEE